MSIQLSLLLMANTKQSASTDNLLLSYQCDGQCPQVLFRNKASLLLVSFLHYFVLELIKVTNSGVFKKKITYN